MAQTGVGRIIDDKYEILASIGHGGMSYVWLCKDKRLNKMWAVKEFRPSRTSSQSAANRQAILDEANFIKRLDHPAIPRVVDIIDTGSSVFVVMDYVDGTSLDKALRQQGEPFEQERVIEWGIQLCDVLDYLHGSPTSDGYPVVYRDMKPANIMLRGDDTVKVLDFGIAMELMPSGPSDMRIIGTPGYGAPEQIDKELHKTVPVDARADIYALGATLYSLVTGHVPRRGTDETGKQTVDFEMRPIREWNGQLSEGLEHILAKATEHDPLDRYQTAAEMRYDLENYEKLTTEFRATQQRKVRTFRRRLIAAAVMAALGLVCLASSLVVRNTSYDSLIHEASVASTVEDERIETDDSGTRTRTAEASEAESLYRQAIELDPTRIDTYQKLLGVYEQDNLFTTTESQRWNKVWQDHGQDIAGDPQYGKLCYDVGILYLSFYDYADARSLSEDASAVATGQALVANVTQASRWFELAKENASALSDEEVDAASAYLTIGEFHDKVTNASLKGEDATASYEEFWKTLEGLLLPQDGEEAVVKSYKPIVQLRLYQVAFESISSAEYLRGFKSASVSEEAVRTMLDAVRTGTEGQSGFVEVNSEVSQALYDEIVDGYEGARQNIARTYGGTASNIAAQTPSDKEA